MRIEEEQLVSSVIDADRDIEPTHPHLCFNYICKDYNVENQSKKGGFTSKDWGLLFIRLGRIMEQPWSVIESSPREQFGYEILRQKDLLKTVPTKFPFTCKDEDRIFTIFRLNQTCRMFGLRIGAIYYVFAFDLTHSFYK